MAKILVVEDEKALADSICEWLVLEGHATEVAYDGMEAQTRIGQKEFDVVVLDIMLPKMNGLEICRNHRKNGGRARILMLTAKGSVADKEDALDSGADDYMTKPFDLKELAARIRALMRRSVSLLGNHLQVSDVLMDLESRQVTRGGHQLRLMPQEFALLEFLLRNPDRIFSPESLIAKVWHGNSSIDTVRTHIKTLRKKLDRPGEPELIKTVHGVGYSLQSGS